MFFCSTFFSFAFHFFPCGLQIVLRFTILSTSHCRDVLSALNLFNPKGRKLFSRLLLDLSHLNTHKFQHKSCTNSLCRCMFETETAVHFLLCCHGYTNIRITLTNDLHQINKKNYFNW